MESTTRNVQTWMASSRDEEINALVDEVSNGTTTLVNVVKALGEYLTSEEDGIRTKGVELLSSVISKCPSEKMTRQSVRVLVTFYCSKLEDIETIIPALNGLLSLSRLPSCTSEDVPIIMRAFFAHVKMNVLVQSVRFNVYTFIDVFMDRHRQALKDMGKEFLAGYTALAEGEKDPRNLLVAFAIARVILIEFDITGFVENLFNVTFCYFPITFRPPPNDPYGISTDDLKAALRDCLNATPEFGPMAIPVFLEKLAAGSPTTKRDTLQTMAACFPVYGAGLARSSARDLWNTLKLEIFQPTDTVTANMALACTQDLVKTIYAVPAEKLSKDNTEVEGLARDVCEECVKILREPEKSQAKPAVKVLCAFMSTTPSISRYTISKSVPYLLQLFAAIDETGGRVSTLLLISDIISAARDSLPNNDSDDAPALIPYKDEVFGVATTGMTNPYLRQSGIACMLGLVSTRNLLTDEELGFVVHKANEVLKENSDAGDDESNILKLLTTLSTMSSHHVVDQTLPLLFEALPEQPPAREALKEHVHYRRILSALSTLCQQADLFEVFMVRLTTRLELLCVPSQPTISEDSEPRAAYAHAILKTIAQTLALKVDEKHVDVAKYVERHVPRILNLFVYSAMVKPDNQFVATDLRLIRVAADIISLVTQCLSVSRYQTFIQSVFDGFVSGNVKAMAEGQLKIPGDVLFRPLEASASSPQKNLVVLFAASVLSAHKEVAVPVPSLTGFLDGLLEWSLLHAENDLQHDSAWKVISSLVNKHTDDVIDFLNDKVDRFWSGRFADATLEPSQHIYTIRFWIYLSRGLLVQNHALSSGFVDRLFEVFHRDDVGWDAAKSIGKLVEPDDVLLKKHHAVVKILHVQKFVSMTLPRLISGATDPHDEKMQLSHLVALTSLIRSVAKPLYSSQMPVLIPLLMRGMDLEDNDIRVNVIETFIAAADGDTPEHSLISANATSLVAKMLKYSMHGEMPAMKVRIAALRYLGTLPRIVRYDILHPSKAKVVKDLAKALDDPKRPVRKEAVEARTNWIKYSG